MRRLWVVEYYDRVERVWKIPEWVNRLEDVVFVTRSDARAAQDNLRRLTRVRTRIVPYVPEPTRGTK